MYAKLVVGSGPNKNSQGLMRDIGRLITSPAPSLANVLYFSNTLSVIVDATPAGWTYVGSSDATDRPTINNGVYYNLANTNSTIQNYVFSAPCANTVLPLKYVALTTSQTSNLANNYSICLTGATNSNANGVLTNEGARVTLANQNDLTYRYYGANASLAIGYSGQIIHLIATPKTITIIADGLGMAAHWESSATDMHLWNNTAPQVQYCHYNVQQVTCSGLVTVDNYTATAGSVYPNTIFSSVFNYTAPNGQNFGVYDPGQVGVPSSGYVKNNVRHLFQASPFPNVINNGQVGSLIVPDTFSNTGTTRYQLTNLYYENPEFSYPTSYITGVTGVFIARTGMGSSGETAIINGNTYYIFNLSSNTLGFNVLLQAN